MRRSNVLIGLAVCALLASGTNDLYNVGCCTAGPGYDTASGWGGVDFGAVARYFKNSVTAAP